MRIAIDARMYGDFGIGRYNKNLIYHLQKIDSINEYFILHTQKDFDEYQYTKNFKKVLADFHWYGLAEQIKLPKVLNEIKPDLVHFPHFNVPVFYKGNFVVTIHDLTHQYFTMKRATTHGSLMYFIKQKGYKSVFKNAITKASKIITPSMYVKNLVIKEYPVSEKKIVVTYEAVEDKIIDLAKKIKKEQVKIVLDKFSIKSPYLFYIGNAHPHKNVEGLIKSFLSLRKDYQYLQLVLAGEDSYFWPRIKSEFQNKDIIYTGHITDEELVALYKNSQVLVMPSYEEGFGIPLLEAMSCQTAVVSSNAASLPEVGGDAALYFDPKNKDDIARKIIQVLNSEKLRNELIAKGQERAKEFSWQKLAEETQEVYLHAGSTGSR